MSRALAKTPSKSTLSKGVDIILNAIGWKTEMTAIDNSY